jgi:hypothetical protein
MRFARSAALALIAAASAEAQPAIPDLSTATPIAGSWTYTATANGSEATFLNTSAMPQVTIRCTLAARRVTIAKPASGAAPYLSVWTSAASRNLLASFNPATMRLSADVAATDPLLDAIAFSRGRFGVSVSAQPALVLPAWAEPSRVIEDCRG